MDMTAHRITASARIDAAPKRVYNVIADYCNGHPRILPKQFSDLVVERGGFGAGTVIRFRMRVGGRLQTFRAAVTEPDPGRVLVETSLEGRLAVTTFTVSEADGGQASVVNIATDLPVRFGPLGAIERFLTTRALQALYHEELRLLAAVVQDNIHLGDRQDPIPAETA
jgi:hypothetical protein